MSKLSTEGFAFEDIRVELSHTHVVSHLCSQVGIDREVIKASVRARDSESSGRLLEKYKVTWIKTTSEPSKDLVPFNLPKHLPMTLQLFENDVCNPLSGEYKGVHFCFNLHRLTGLGYYDGPCFHIKAKNDRGETYMLADGGFVNWTQLLLADAKERLMTSAIGVELMCRMFLQTKS